MRILRSPQSIVISLFLLGLAVAMINNFAGAIIFFCGLLYSFYVVARNFAGNFLLISIWLFFGPLFISTFIWVFLFEYFSDFLLNVGDGKFIFLSIPIISVVFVYSFRRLEGFFDRLKISLKINNVIVVCLTFGFIWYAYSTEDFSQIIPSINELKEYNIGPREFITLMLQVITFPYIISNLLSDLVIEVATYLRRARNRSS
ncbi:hypothetical protein ACE6ED_00135 [Paenibacillus sp. CN-4]|uniref:hypothetical protein n=1 Tax=Paenibacillus nanchangensis TaxID=3348343 RepID=UPI0039782B5C